MDIVISTKRSAWRDLSTTLEMTKSALEMTKSALEMTRGLYLILLNSSSAEVSCILM